MMSEGCVTLQSCQTQEIKYVNAGFSGGPTDIFWTDNIGAVVQITDPANFPDIYYTIINHCSSFESVPGNDCFTCFRTGDFLDLTYVTLTEYESCPTVTAYVLLNCSADADRVFPEGNTPNQITQSVNTAFVTSSDLALYVGSVVHIEEYPNVCFQVLGPYTSDTGCPCNYYTVTNAFKDCSCCVTVEPEPFVRTHQKPVKNFTLITESECDLRVITKFATNYYNYYKQIRYGLQDCCGNIDMDRLWMQMQMVEYSRLLDPAACVPPVDPVVVDCPISPLA